MCPACQGSLLLGRTLKLLAAARLATRLRSPPTMHTAQVPVAVLGSTIYLTCMHAQDNKGTADAQVAQQQQDAKEAAFDLQHRHVCQHASTPCAPQPCLRVPDTACPCPC